MIKIVTIALMMISASIFAQDQVAKNILDKLSTATKSYKNIKINFSYIFENTTQGINESQQGILTLEGDNFKLEIDEQTIINNGESQWIYLKDINEVQIMEHDPNEDMMNPNKLFKIYENNYKYTYIGSKYNEGKKLQIIDLFPIESSSFIKFNIIIDEELNQLRKITLYDKNGGTYTYLITSFISNTTIEPFQFNLNEFPGVEVIDLR